MKAKKEGEATNTKPKFKNIRVTFYQCMSDTKGHFQGVLKHEVEGSVCISNDTLCKTQKEALRKECRLTVKKKITKLSKKKHLVPQGYAIIMATDNIL